MQEKQIFGRGTSCQFSHEPVTDSNSITSPKTNQQPSLDNDVWSVLPDYRFCTTRRKLYLSCGGAIVHEEDQDFVLNCITGKISKKISAWFCWLMWRLITVAGPGKNIPARGRFKKVDKLGGFCCASRDLPDSDHDVSRAFSGLGITD